MPQLSTAASRKSSTCTDHSIGLIVEFQGRFTAQRRSHRRECLMKSANSLMSGLGTTVFEVMSALARQHQSVNLGQGFPDDKGPEEVRRAAADYLMDGHNQYPPMMGLPGTAPGRGRARQALPGPRGRLAERGAGDLGRDRGAGRLPVRPDRAGRRGRADRAALRLLPADRAPGRGHPEAGAARAADLEPAARGTGGGLQRPHQAHPVQHADESRARKSSIARNSTSSRSSA